jgi:hypothetical protein
MIALSRSVLNVLLVEEGWTATNQVARALQAAGCRVTVATLGGSYPVHTHEGITWRSGAALRDLRRFALDHDCVLPMTERLLVELEHPAVFPRITESQRRLIADKHALLAQLAAAGVDVPVQRPIDRAHELGFPLVLKGSTGAGGSRVAIVDDARALPRAIARAEELGGTWLAQEHLPSPTYLVGGVFHAGSPLRLYAAEKVEQYPPRTGPAIRLRSDARAALVELGTRAVGVLGWTGLASVDIMRRADGRYVALEINPRPWSSIAGAAEAGVDLFTPLAELLAGRVPTPNLAFEANCESHVFPRYLLADRYWNFGGLARAVRDLLGPRGRDWRDVGFTARYLARYYATRTQWRGF